MKKNKEGIDISYHQGDIDFDAVKKSGVSFVIIREGYRNVTDKKFFEYVNKAKAAGLVILGVYHFSYALSALDAQKEAECCIENMCKAGLGPDVLVFYDFEYDSVEKASRKGVYLTALECNNFTVEFCERVKELGYKPGIYTNKDYYRNWYYKHVLDNYDIWLADYQGTPQYNCIVQQYTSAGKVPGIKGDVDRNRYFEEFYEEPKTEGNTVLFAACRTILGEYGNGNERKEKIEELGLDYSAVQELVNKIMKI